MQIVLKIAAFIGVPLVFIVIVIRAIYNFAFFYNVIRGVSLFVAVINI